MGSGQLLSLDAAVSAYENGDSCGTYQQGFYEEYEVNYKKLLESVWHIE